MSDRRYFEKQEHRASFLKRGCPVDEEKIIATSPMISITPLGLFETSLFDMYCGGTGCVIHIRVAAREETITVCDFLLTLPASFPQINWLADPAEQVPPRGLYRLPNGLEFPRNSVLNHRVLGGGVLHRGACLEGLLLGWGSGRIPAHLRHGAFLIRRPYDSGSARSRTYPHGLIVAKQGRVGS